MLNLTDRFNFNVDCASEKAVKDRVDVLNYSLDNIISGIIRQLDLEKKKIKPAITFDRVFEENLDPAYMGPLKPLYKLLRSGRFIDPEDRDFFLDVLLHNKICQSLDRAWFAGRTFYGYHGDNEPLSNDVLERMYDEILENSGFFELSYANSELIKPHRFLELFSTLAVYDLFCHCFPSIK